VRIRPLNCKVFYVPYNSHSLNLVFNCLEANFFFGVIQEICVFSASTHRRDILLKYIPNLTVEPLSVTRRSSRVNAFPEVQFRVNEIYENLNGILEDNTLTNISRVSRAEANEIVNKITNFNFLCSLAAWYYILYEINISSQLLQSPSFYISECINQMSSTKKIVYEYRSEKGFAKTIETARNLANTLDK